LHVSGYDGPVYDGVPAVGEHTREVLSDELGLTPDELGQLQADGVISRVAADGISTVQGAAG
jgi:crotonobetainyl-CoA:carnitine CoA-transferase CaiB-like acyl-CoA transferase